MPISLIAPFCLRCYNQSCLPQKKKKKKGTLTDTKSDGNIHAGNIVVLAHPKVGDSGAECCEVRDQRLPKADITWNREVDEWYPKTTDWKTSTTMRRWNCQAIGVEMEKGMIKNRMDVHCGHPCGKHKKTHLAWEKIYIYIHARTLEHTHVYRCRIRFAFLI